MVQYVSLASCVLCYQCNSSRRRRRKRISFGAAFHVYDRGDIRVFEFVWVSDRSSLSALPGCFTNSLMQRLLSRYSDLPPTTTIPRQRIEHAVCSRGKFRRSSLLYLGRAHLIR